MRVLVVGSGAREHAIIWKLSQSPRITQLYCAPGNGGTRAIAENLAISATDVADLVEWAQAHSIDLTVIGPEDPLAAGIADRFRELSLPVFGPSKEGARIESSKAWAKELMQRYHVPTAASATFTEPSEAEEYLRHQSLPIVVKADGLAAGKGVIVAHTREEALAAVAHIMKDRAVGEAGSRIIIEECLTGVEVSVLAFTDGKSIRPMVPACDYKRVFDNDNGPNTGGMGAYSPPRFATKELLAQIEETVLQPIVDGMAAEDVPYSGVLYAGMMVTESGPKVLEFNCRFGDPETQVILPRLKSDLLDVMLRIVEGKLGEADVQWSEEASCGVVLASGGYPGPFAKGYPISGLETIDSDALVFQAGTARQGGATITSGGRVLTVVGLDKDLAGARAKAYANATRISFDGCHYRKDVALREV
ncbi:MAG: phosphoribosylamine--glycine ligase [Chloroflexi bacterium]|nr:phosphoribosylamine--glycine ligase [Chloroflexota bacterium]